MQDLINALLNYSRVGTRGREFVPTDLSEAVREVLDTLRITIEKEGAEVDVETLPIVQADPTQMRQIFQNLIGNALKFRGAEPPRIQVSARREGKHWVLSVSDNGIGIDREYVERIFVIFQRLHGRDRYPGTGIGLAICRKIVERHGGRIWVESEPGRGSRFFFTMPAEPAPIP